jgi:Mg-chelatase subunit ChlD
MSPDDSKTSASASAATKGKASANRTPLIIGVVLALVVAGLAFFFLRGGDDPNASNCVIDEVLLTTAPATKGIVEKAVAAVEKDEDCIDFKVSEGTVKDVVATLNNPDGVMPEIWVPDSPTWKGQLAAAGWSGTPIAEVIAQTPVGLVSGPAATPPASWTEAIRNGRVSLADPSAEGASALALLAPHAEKKQTGEDIDSINRMMVPIAQAFGERAVAGQDNMSDLSTIGATSTELVPVTEQAYLQARRGNEQLTMVAPKSGVPMLKYPIVSVKKGGGDVGGGRNDLSARAGRALAHWFTSSEGRQAIAEAEFRAPDAASLEGVGLGEAKSLPDVPQKETDEALRAWRVASVPSSILAVIDLSGSMKLPIGNTTRIKLATGAAATALDVLPDQARIGSWGFSKNRGGDGRGWEQYFDLTRLDADHEGQVFREVLRADTIEMAKRVRGGTAVYDTLLAAFKHAQDKWDPAYFNAVVLFTDGASDDTSGMSVDRLLENLKTARDPRKPVKVVIIGISQDADTPEMVQIATATGGRYYLVETPDDILKVLNQALMDR